MLRVVAIVGVLGVLGGAAYFGWTRLGAASHDPDLALLPANSSIVIAVRFREVWESAVGRSMRSAHAESVDEFTAEMTRKTGFGPAEVERIAVGGDPDDRMPTVIVTLRSPLDRARFATIAEAMRLDATPVDVDGVPVWSSARRREAVAQLRPACIVLGTPASVRQVLAASRGDAAPPKLVDLLRRETRGGAAVQVAFDWTASESLRRDVDRGLRRIVPVLFKHVGPVVAEAEIRADDNRVTAKIGRAHV